MEYDVCSTCHAMVYVEYIWEHQQWHEDLRDFIRATAIGEA